MGGNASFSCSTPFPDNPEGIKVNSLSQAHTNLSGMRGLILRSSKETTMLLSVQQLVLLKVVEEEGDFVCVVNLIHTLRLVGPRLFGIGNGRHRVTIVLFSLHSPMV